MNVRALLSQSYSNRTLSNIQETINKAKTMGASAIWVNVHEGGAHYNSAYFGRCSKIEAGLDPLGKMIELAHAEEIEVYPWLTPGYDIYQVDPSTRIWLSDVQRSWTYFALPAAKTAQQALLDDIAGKYAIDGFLLDYIRYPKTQDSRANKDDVSAIVEASYAKAQTLDLPLYATVASNVPDNGRYMYQHWDEWLDGEYIDLVFPMIYYDVHDAFKLSWDTGKWPHDDIARIGICLAPVNVQTDYSPKPKWYMGDEMEIVRSLGSQHFAVFDSRLMTYDHADKISRMTMGRTNQLRAVSFHHGYRETAIVVEKDNESTLLRYETDPWGAWQGIANKTDEQVQAMLPIGVWCHKHNDGVWSLHISDDEPTWEDVTHPQDGEEIQATADTPDLPDPGPQPDWETLRKLEHESADLLEQLAQNRRDIAEEYNV